MKWEDTPTSKSEWELSSNQTLRCAKYLRLRLLRASAQVGLFHHAIFEEVLGREARKLTSQDWWSIKGRRLPAQR